MNGHCRHCADRCLLWPTSTMGQHFNQEGSLWHDGHCPACAEADRIADAIDAALADALDAYTTADYTAGIRHAAEIAGRSR